ECLLSLWQQIATHYRDYPNGLYFEIYNEPCKNMNSIWNQYAADTLQVIRSTNPTRKVVIDVADYAHASNISALSIPNDSNLAVSFHFYEPSNFCFQGMAWANMGGVSGITWEGTAAQKQTLTDLLDNVVTWSAAHSNVELWNGEFCAHYYANINDRARWTAFVARECESRNIGWAYWDFHEESCGIYDPDKQSFRPEILNSLIPTP
ncbi:MAG TPA: cellulase family glycosylhydrolase, partial [Spirochaetota bacterium]